MGERVSQKNQIVYSDSPEFLERMEEEFRVYVGRDTYLDRKRGCLTVLALPRKYKRKAKMEARARRRDEEMNPDWDQYNEER